MLKEIIICIIIIASIISLDVFTQNFTEKTVSEISEDLNSLKQIILNENIEKMKKKANNIYNNWEDKNGKLAYFIEHDELEKVSNCLVETKSYIETKNYTDAIAELEEGIFVLKHIQEKNAFNLKNIF